MCTELKTIEYLLLSCQQALWMHVPPCLRMVSVSLDGFKITWRCTFDKDATDNDIELLQQAAAQVIAGYSSEYKLIEIYEIIPFPDKIIIEETIAYYRHEHGYFK